MDDPLAHLLDVGLELSRDHRYVVERELGRGSMGVVYAGRDVLLDRPVAIKVMAGSMTADADLRRYFEREAQAAGRLAHRNVVTVHDFGYDGRGAPFVVMELLRGRDLRQVALSGAPLSLDRRLAVVLQVLAGLAHAHASGVVHRDVKPANVFITEEGVVKLLDFGIARLLRTSRGDSSDAVMGTADYMSPEQVLGADVDGRSDLFSCGALLFELLGGQPPFHAESFVTIAYRVVHEQPDYTLLPHSCRALEPVLRKALAKSRDERYRTAPDFASDIAITMGVGVAPETIQPAPAWTIPLPRLFPVPSTVSLRGHWEEGALRPPDLSPVRPRWPLRAHDDDEPPAGGARRRRELTRRVAWSAAGAAAAVMAFGAGAARWMTTRPLSAPVVVVDSRSQAAGAALAVPEPPATTALEPPLAPPATPADPVEDPPASGPAPLAMAPPIAIAPAAGVPTAPGRPAAGATGPFWRVAASPAAPAAEAARAAPLPAPAPQEPAARGPALITGRWTGFVTDDSCREKGAVNDHGQCLESCLRRGRRPLIAIDGQLYALMGLERIRGQNDRRVVVEGQLDPARRVLTVSAGWPAR